MSIGSTAVAGITKLFDTTGASTEGSLTQAAITNALNGKLSTAGTAAAAENDSVSQNISNTYIKNAASNQTTVTFTRGNDTTFAIQTKDTTYSTGTSAAAGLTKLYGSTGSSTDGTMTRKAISNSMSTYVKSIEPIYN